MRVVAGSLTALLLAAACGSAGAMPTTTEESAASRPALRIVALTPLTVKGTGFVAGERVKLLVGSGGGKRKAVIADRRGRFTVRLAIEADRCESVVVQAFGTRGSRAMVDLTAPNCARP